MASPPWKNIQNFQRQKFKTYYDEKLSMFTYKNQEEIQKIKLITLIDKNNSQSKFLIRTSQHTTVLDILDLLKQTLGQNNIYQLLINNYEISQDELKQNLHTLLGNTEQIYFIKNRQLSNSLNPTTRESKKIQRKSNQFFRSSNGNNESNRSIKFIQNQEIKGQVNQFYSSNNEDLIQNNTQNNFTLTEQHVQQIINQINPRLSNIELQIQKIISKDQDQDEQIKQLFKLFKIFQEKYMEIPHQQKEVQQNQGNQEKQPNISIISEQEIKQKLYDLGLKQLSLENQINNLRLNFEAQFSDQNLPFQKQKEILKQTVFGNQGNIIPTEAQIFLILQCHHQKEIEVLEQVIENPIIKDNSKICSQCNKPFTQICRNLGYIGRQYLEKYHSDNLKIIYENQKKLHPDEIIKCKNCDFFCKVNSQLSYQQNNYCPICCDFTVIQGIQNQEQIYIKKN